ncbi:MAG: DUF4404 family protein [Anaerolineae bacterium]|nr:DUF4404 family protein [Anaerolineae bacterium]
MSDQPGLNQLQESLNNAQPATPEQAAAVEELKGDVNKALVEPEHRATLRERLEKHVVLFEDSHPQLGAAMHSAINTLSLGGI